MSELFLMALPKQVLFWGSFLSSLLECPGKVQAKREGSDSMQGNGTDASRQWLTRPICQRLVFGPKF